MLPSSRQLKLTKTSFSSTFIWQKNWMKGPWTLMSELWVSILPKVSWLIKFHKVVMLVIARLAQFRHHTKEAYGPRLTWADATRLHSCIQCRSGGRWKSPPNSCAPVLEGSETALMGQRRLSCQCCLLSNCYLVLHGAFTMAHVSVALTVLLETGLSIVLSVA